MGDLSAMILLVLQLNTFDDGPWLLKLEGGVIAKR